MKNFNKISMTFMKILQVVFIIFIILALAFIIKWRIDHIYLNANTKGKAHFTISAEIKKTTMEIEKLLGKNEESYQVPVVEEVQEEKNSLQITVPEGSDVESLGKILLENNLIKDINAYKLLMERMGLDKAIVPGTYDIKNGMKVKEILALICNRQIKEFEFSLAQGVNADDVGRALKNIGLIQSVDAFKTECKNLGVNSFKAGDYKIEAPLKVKYIIDEIKSDEI
ncbi:MAG: endolytic transglycosylase MltG [Peptoniphilus lacrimalis]